MKTTDMRPALRAKTRSRSWQTSGLDIRLHRKRLVEEDLDERFKDANDLLRLVFVCAMWITGFDVPSCSTIYLDKPMKNHTLMQTIARANRNFPGKRVSSWTMSGCSGTCRRRSPSTGVATLAQTSSPIRDKSDLVEYLRHILAETQAYLFERGVDPSEIKQAKGLEKVALIGEAVEKLIETDEAKREYLGRARAVSWVYKAILPDRASSEFTADVLITVLAERIRSLMSLRHQRYLAQDVEDLLDRSVAPIPYETPGEPPEVIDISQTDFDKLRAKFDTGKQRTEAERLRALLSQKLGDGRPKPDTDRLPRPLPEADRRLQQRKPEHRGLLSGAGEAGRRPVGGGAAELPERA